MRGFEMKKKAKRFGNHEQKFRYVGKFKGRKVLVCRLCGKDIFEWNGSQSMCRACKEKTWHKSSRPVVPFTQSWVILSDYRKARVKAHFDTISQLNLYCACQMCKIYRGIS